MPVTWVVFDYGGVLSHQQGDGDLALLASAAGVSAADLQRPYWDLRHRYDLGELDAAGYWQELGRRLGRQYTAAQAASLSALDCASWQRLQPAMVALVEELAAAGHPLALLSNAPFDMTAVIRGMPLAERFRELFFSCELASAKPDPACYAAVLARLGAAASDVIFLDDRPENVAGAAAAGIAAVQFTTPAAARQALTGQLRITPDPDAAAH